MPIDTFKSCTQTPKSEKISWKGQGKAREFWNVEVLDTLCNNGFTDSLTEGDDLNSKGNDFIDKNILKRVATSVVSKNVNQKMRIT